MKSAPHPHHRSQPEEEFSTKEQRQAHNLTSVSAFPFVLSHPNSPPLLSSESLWKTTITTTKTPQAQIFLASTETICSKEVMMKTSFVSSLLSNSLSQKLSMRRYPGKSSRIHRFPLGRITKKVIFGYWILSRVSSKQKCSMIPLRLLKNLACTNVCSYYEY